MIIIIYTGTGPAGPFNQALGWRWCIYVTDWTAAVMASYLWASVLSVLNPTVYPLDAIAWFLHDITGKISIHTSSSYHHPHHDHDHHHHHYYYYHDHDHHHL